MNQEQTVRMMEALQAQLNALKAENDALKARKKTLSLKLTDKGCISIIGLRRFPVALYRDEWNQVFSMREQIETFIQENSGKIPEKR
jgi:hypothetical protein